MNVQLKFQKVYYENLPFLRCFLLSLKQGRSLSLPRLEKDLVEFWKDYGKTGKKPGVRRTIKRHFSNDPWKSSEFTTRRVVENALPLVKTSTTGRNKASAPMQQSQGETEKSLDRLNSTYLLIVQQTKQLFVFTIKKEFHRLTKRYYEKMEIREKDLPFQDCDGKMPPANYRRCCYAMYARRWIETR